MVLGPRHPGNSSSRHGDAGCRRCRHSHRGTGKLPPLLLTAHLDVVEADPSTWTHPPFGGVIADGCLWGRGAIDMKNMAAMSVAIMRRLALDKPKLARDVIFAGVADEEAGSDAGARWLVESHPDLVRAEYALGEVGGATLYVGDRRVVDDFEMRVLADYGRLCEERRVVVDAYREPRRG